MHVSERRPQWARMAWALVYGTEVAINGSGRHGPFSIFLGALSVFVYDGV